LFVSLALAGLAALQIAAFYCAWRAVSSARTPQGAVGWVVFLLSAPYIAVLLYLFLGHHRYRGYLISRRSSERVIEGVRDFGAAYRPETPPLVDPAPFERIAELPAVRGNALTPLIDGQASFDAIFAAIDAAKNYVLVQFFIVHDDELGRAFRDRLIAAAGRGVSVRFMADAVGSKSLPPSYLDALRRAGVEVADPRAGNRPRNRFQINYRNHRKTVVIDGQTGFTGGLNVGDEYMGRDPKFGAWRDTHLEMKGPVVAQLQLIFAEDWHWATGETLLEALDWTSAPAEADATALLVPTGPADSMETGALFFFAAIAAARERVWIASPYCVPDTDILTALKHAALAGRDVRLLVPEVVDHLSHGSPPSPISTSCARRGCQVWRYQPGFMHQKVVLVDDTLAAIGTTNLDNRSFRLNFEAMVLGFDARFAADVAAFFEADFAKRDPPRRSPVRTAGPRAIRRAGRPPLRAAALSRDQLPGAISAPRRPLRMSATVWPSPSKAEVTARSIKASGSAPSSVTASVSRASSASTSAMRSASAACSAAPSERRPASSERVAAISSVRETISARSGNTVCAASLICSDTRSAAESALHASHRQSAARTSVAFRSARTRFLALRTRLRSVNSHLTFSQSRTEDGTPAVARQARAISAEAPETGGADCRYRERR
jgi:cardiolipin synthase